MFKFAKDLYLQTRFPVRIAANSISKNPHEFEAIKNVSVANLQARRVHISEPRALSISTPTQQLSNNIQESKTLRDIHRYLTSLKVDTASSETIKFIKDDLDMIHERSKEVLRKYITNQEMYDIAKYYITGPQENFLTFTGTTILVGKALKHHMCQNGNLTERQLKAVTIAELLSIFSILNDDLADNGKTRFNMPAANVLWYPYKVVMTVNMILAITVSEAAQLSQEITTTVCQMHESQYRGQYMTEEQRTAHGDMLSHYMMRSEYKSGDMVGYAYKLMAEALGVSTSTAHNVSRMGYNIGMGGQLLDDYDDLETDLKDGLATANVLFAMKEYPEIEEMVLRKFKGVGDVQRTMQLVYQSGALEETQSLAMRYFTGAFTYLNMLADSPYRDAFLMFVISKVEKKLGSHAGKIGTQLKD